jgi:hypothetical protein
MKSFLKPLWSRCLKKRGGKESLIKVVYDEEAHLSVKEGKLPEGIFVEWKVMNFSRV